MEQPTSSAKTLSSLPVPVPLILGNANVSIYEDYAAEDDVSSQHITFYETTEAPAPAYIASTFQSAVTMLRVVSQVGGDLWHQPGATPLSSSPIFIKSSTENLEEKSSSGSAHSPVLIAVEDLEDSPPAPPSAPSTPQPHTLEETQLSNTQLPAPPASTEAMRKNCLQLITEVMKHRHASPFNVAVDPVALGLSDYFDIIKHPMDLGTIKKRLDNDQYESLEQFERDVRLVFSNALAYGGEGSDVAIMADNVRRYFEKLLPATRERIASESSAASSPPHSDLAKASAATTPVQKPAAAVAPISSSPQSGSSPSSAKPSAAISASPKSAQPTPMPTQPQPKAPVSKASSSGSVNTSGLPPTGTTPPKTQAKPSSASAVPPVTKVPSSTPSVPVSKSPKQPQQQPVPATVLPPQSAIPKQQPSTTAVKPSATTQSTPAAPSPAMSSSIEMRPQLSPAQMRFLRDTASALTRDYIRPLLRACIHDDRLASLFATSLQIGLGHFLPWWITSASRVAELKLRVIDALLDGLASFLDDYNGIISAHRERTGKQLDDENTILVQFAVLFHSRNQQYAFQPTVDAAGEAEIKRRCSAILLDQVWPLIAELPAVLQLHREFEEDYKELVLQQLSLVEEVLSALLDPMLLFEFVAVMATRLDAVAKQPVVEAPKPSVNPKQPIPAFATAVDFTKSIRKLQNSLVAIARLPFLLSNPIELLLKVLVESKLQAAIHDSIATSETPKAKLELLKTVRELLWNTTAEGSPSASPQPSTHKGGEPVTVKLVPIVDTSLFKQGQVKDRESLEKLIAQMLESLLLIIRTRSFIPGAASLAKDPLRNLLTCIVNITQQPKVSKTLIFHYLLPRIFTLLQ